MRFRPVAQKQVAPRRPAPTAVCPKPPAPPQMDNPYSRHFTRPRTLEDLRKKG